MKVEKQCIMCEKSFFAANNKGKYCSAACRMVAYRKRNLKYKFQQKDLTILEKVQTERAYYIGAYSWSQLQCKKYKVKIDELMAEKQVLRELNNRLFKKSESSNSKKEA
jgi:hypothetical protein